MKNSDSTPLLALLLEGRRGSGCTALAAQLAIESEFSFTKLISPEDFVGWTENAKCSKIAKVFDDAYKSTNSLIILDNIERLLGYVDLGPRFSNPTLQTLLVLIKKVPPVEQKTDTNRRLLVIGTTSSREILESMDMLSAFNVILDCPYVRTPDEFREVFAAVRAPIDEEDLTRIADDFVTPIGIKNLLMLIEMTTQNCEGRITYRGFMESARDCGINIKLSSM